MASSTLEEGVVKVKHSAAPSFTTIQNSSSLLKYAWRGTQAARIPIFKLLVAGLLLFDLIMTIEIVSYVPKSPEYNEEVCSPRVVDPKRVNYHSQRKFNSTLKTTDLPPPPTFHGDHTTLCYEQARMAAQYGYCLPTSGRKDTPLCASADRMDLLHRESSKPICYASILHMLLVEVYEELQATGNTPF